MTVSIDRRRFLQTVAGAALATAPRTVRCAAAPRQPGRPNVLFLMTDEQHHRSLSATGNPYVQTPHMDRLAREGARFENATCVTPYCSPSRASILTGVYPHRHRILMNVSGKKGGGQAPLRPDAFPSTEMTLHKQGYAMGHRGKWHLGDQGDWPCYESYHYASKTANDYKAFLDERLPASRFAADRDPGQYLGRPVVKIPAIRNGWQKFQDARVGVSYIATIGRTVIPPDLLPETQITGQVLDLIDRHARDNFMITASWSPPHDLWVTPEPYYSMVDRAKVKPAGTTDLPAWDRNGPSRRLGEIMGPEGIREYAAIYHGMVKYIDDQLGKILKKLDDLGLAENTLVIFTTDHGDMVGAHGCIGKSITSIFDDLLRIPLLMRLPGRIRPGTVVRQFVSQIDFMPTILDYLDLPVPRDIHGRSARPLLEGRDVPWRDHAFCQRADRIRMIRTDRYKYTFGDKPGIVSLYDLKEDPNEDRNLAGDAACAETVRLMHKRLLEVMKADGDPLANKLPSDPLA